MKTCRGTPKDGMPRGTSCLVTNMRAHRVEKEVSNEDYHYQNLRVPDLGVNWGLVKDQVPVVGVHNFTAARNCTARRNQIKRCLAARSMYSCAARINLLCCILSAIPAHTIL